MAVHDIETGKPVHELNFQPYQHSPTQEHYCERIAVGEDYFAIVTGVGEIILVKKESAKLSDKMGNSRVNYITMSNNKVLAEVGEDWPKDGRISVLETTESGSWKIKSVSDIDSNPTNDISTDGDWVATGTGEGCKIWKLSELDKGPVYRIRAETYRMVWHFRFLFVLGAVPPFGLEVWNVLTDTSVRYVTLDHQGFEFRGSGDFLAL